MKTYDRPFSKKLPNPGKIPMWEVYVAGQYLETVFDWRKVKEYEAAENVVLVKIQ